MVAKRKRPAQYRYPGWLGKPQDAARLIPAQREFLRENPNATDAALDQHLWKRKIELGFDALTALFEHYGIAPTAKDCWPQLVWKLAANHVPAFQFADMKMGRPPTLRNWFAPSKREQQRRRAVAADRALLADYERGAASLSAKGRYVTNETAFIEAGALDGLASWRARAQAKSRAKRLSKVRKRSRRNR